MLRCPHLSKVLSEGEKTQVVLLFLSFGEDFGEVNNKIK